jgi:hypothetical protein
MNGELREWNKSQREAKRRLRELEREAKERAKLSEMQQARLEVETYENRLDVLLSVHKDCGETQDWSSLAVSFPPPMPQRLSRFENRIKREIELATALGVGTSREQGFAAAIQQARYRDEREYEEALQTHAKEKAAMEEISGLARRVLAGEHKAYTRALVEFNPFGEIAELGSSIHFTVHSAKLIECKIKVNGQQVIPKEAKSLTTTGKLSVKQMPNARYHEIYQDYVCSCVLRVAREVFALLPVEVVLITALADLFDSRTGQSAEKPVLSVAIPRGKLEQLDFDRLDPSDSMENFFHLGNFRATRKAGAFEPITPLTPTDVRETSIDRMKFTELVENVRRLRGKLRAEIDDVSPQTTEAANENPRS